MNDRLVAVMEHYEYTPSLFADEIGVIRSTISHIINGRNKPGVDILQKVLARFPELSAEWLLTGSGKMLKQAIEERTTENKEFTNVNTSKNFAQLTLDDFTSVADQEEIKATAQEKTIIEEVSSAKEAEPAKEAKIEGESHHLHEIKIDTERNIVPIKRITVYYRDNTYTDFFADAE